MATKPKAISARLLGDDPVEDLAEDALDRGPFADRIVELLDGVAADTPSAVLGLIAPWGSGKTSVLNILRKKLSGHGAWQVVELNPWMVADLNSMIDEFFITLLSTMPEGKKGRALRKKVARYAKAVAPVTSPLKLAGLNLEDALKSVEGLLEGDQSLDARRRELEDALRHHGKPILMIADDLDRLQPDELLLIFKLVRLLGRLPNTYYLLALDERTALDVIGSTDLARTDPKRALAYLEKVIQVRLDLPPARPQQVVKLLDGLLQRIAAKHEAVLTDIDEHRLSRAFHDHMSTYLTEPRQVKRYCAQLEALYPLVKDEVDFVDFAVVTFIRTFHPGVVALLVRNRAELTRTKIEYPRPSHDARAARWRQSLADVEVPPVEVGPLLGVLGDMFLVIKGALEGAEYSGFGKDRVADRRVDTAEYFDRYFYLGIGDGDLSDSTARAALDELLAGSPGPAWSKVLETMVVDDGLVLAKLRRLAPQDPSGAERIAVYVARLNSLTSDAGFLASGPFVVRQWLSEVLEQAQPDDTQRFVREVANAGGVRLLSRAINSARRRADEESRSVTASILAMQSAVVELIIEDLERQARLAPKDTEGVLELLSMWRILDPSADVKVWLRNVVESMRWPMPDVLGLFTPTARTTVGDRTFPSLGEPSLDFLDEVLGIDFVTSSLEEPADQVVEDAPFSEADVSFEGRTRHTLRFIVHRAALTKAAAEHAERDRGEARANLPLVDTDESAEGEDLDGSSNA